jgi:hypothetical protein
LTSLPYFIGFNPVPFQQLPPNPLSIEIVYSAVRDKKNEFML